MKTIIKFLITIFITTGVVSAEDRPWWEKGLDLLKSTDNSNIVSEPTLTEMTQAFKQALEFASSSVVKQLGQNNGFNKDPNIHIPLPDQLRDIQSILSKVGLSQYTDDLEVKLNRAAEAATPKAKQLFLNAIQEMTFDDVKTIYEGPDDSATRYFQSKMSPDLSREMEPIVSDTLSQVGAINTYNQFMSKYEDIPFVPDVQANLTEYTVNKGLDGIFYYLAKEEAKIRQDPVKQTTDLLKKVFGSN